MSQSFPAPDPPIPAPPDRDRRRRRNRHRVRTAAAALVIVPVTAAAVAVAALAEEPGAGLARLSFPDVVPAQVEPAPAPPLLPAPPPEPPLLPAPPPEPPCRRRRLSRRSAGAARPRSAATPAGGSSSGVQLPAERETFFTWDPVLRRSPNRPWRRWGTDRLVRMVLRRRARPPGRAPGGAADGGRRPEPSARRRLRPALRLHRAREPPERARRRRVLPARRRPRARAALRVRRSTASSHRSSSTASSRSAPRSSSSGPNTGLTGPSGRVQALVNHDNHLHVRLSLELRDLTPLQFSARGAGAAAARTASRWPPRRASRPPSRPPGSPPRAPWRAAAPAGSG